MGVGQAPARLRRPQFRRVSYPTNLVEIGNFGEFLPCFLTESVVFGKVPGQFLVEIAVFGEVEEKNLPINSVDMKQGRTFYPDIESELVVWLGNFYEVLAEQHDAYGITEEQTGELKEVVRTFVDSRTALADARALVRSAQTSKDEARRAAVAMTEEFGRLIRSLPEVSPEQRQRIGLNPGLAQPTFSLPSPPREVRVSLTPSGSILLRWNPSGNARGTRYVVEQTFDGVNWQIVGVSTAAKLHHDSQTPGTPRWYRVVAQRRKLSSLPSQPAGI